MKKINFNTTTILGIVFFLMGLSMWGMWMFMASKQFEVIGLEAWYIWGSMSVGTVLIVVPEDTAISYIKAMANAAICFFQKK